jgi:1,4-alpha-glucan branching enzyme
MERVGCQTVEVAGDFNDWIPQPPKKLRNGLHKTTVDLEPELACQYRYRIDGDWPNDWQADDYIANGLGQDNSVVFCSQRCQDHTHSECALSQLVGRALSFFGRLALDCDCATMC